jgi:dephospho-CoA kinase
MAKIIGLTGGIATGKSTVSDMFKEHGIPVIDTDEIAYDMLKKGTTSYDEVVTLFSEMVLHANGDINRKLLGKAIFNDDDLRIKLNNIIHPKIKSVTLSEVKKYEELGATIIVIDVPLLFETDFIELVDKSIVVYTTPEKQIERLIERDSIEKEYALIKIESQIPIRDKVKLADYVINNSESILTTKKEFNKIIEKLEVM